MAGVGQTSAGLRLLAGHRLLAVAEVLGVVAGHGLLRVLRLVGRLRQRALAAGVLLLGRLRAGELLRGAGRYGTGRHLRAGLRPGVAGLLVGRGLLHRVFGGPGNPGTPDGSGVPGVLGMRGTPGVLGATGVPGLLLGVLDLLCVFDLRAVLGVLGLLCVRGVLCVRELLGVVGLLGVLGVSGVRGVLHGRVPGLVLRQGLCRGCVLLLFGPGALRSGHQEVFLLGRFGHTVRADDGAVRGGSTDTAGRVREGVAAVGRRAVVPLLLTARVLRQPLSRDLTGVSHAFPSPIASAPSNPADDRLTP
ncbi:hypothetical protein SCA03_34660 [Streptomyces cacaoi]|uniref:Uncharacterized protein n=1 Tax=Streptomyces cacaoi TaxID=1898 RepID=A0A4Y3QZS8_STRCI|nr:hypothetical protein SCA03_34660 [Streptomyces cacaoi]